MTTNSRAKLPLRLVNTNPVQPTYRRLGWLIGKVIGGLTRQDWDDAPTLPTGAVIVVSNHISRFDPVALAHYLIWQGRWPRALGKIEIWKFPVIGWLARACGQIPVERGTERAKDALIHARQALADGECVLIYPEGTVTGDPDTWPMTGRPGAARLALSTGAPVIPLGQWGANFVMPGKTFVLPKFWPKQTMTFRMGEQVELSDLIGRTDAAATRIATERIMAAVTALVEQIRGENAPEQVYDLRVKARVPRVSAR